MEWWNYEAAENARPSVRTHIFPSIHHPTRWSVKSSSLIVCVRPFIVDGAQMLRDSRKVAARVECFMDAMNE